MATRYGIVLRQAKISTLVLEHPETPWLAKFVDGCAVLYVVRPIQVLPACIPVLGQWGDLLVMWIGMKLLRKMIVFAECEARVKSGPLLKAPRVKSSIHDERGFSDLTRTDRPTVDASEDTEDPTVNPYSMSGEFGIRR